MGPRYHHQFVAVVGDGFDGGGHAVDGGRVGRSTCQQEGAAQFNHKRLPNRRRHSYEQQPLLLASDQFTANSPRWFARRLRAPDAPTTYRQWLRGDLLPESLHPHPQAPASAATQFARMAFSSHCDERRRRNTQRAACSPSTSSPTREGSPLQHETATVFVEAKRLSKLAS